MKKLLCLSIAFMVTVFANQAYGSLNPAVGGNGGNTLIAWKNNDVSVIQSIASVGGGVYEYTFDFTTSDPSDVWHFVVYTSFDTTFTGGTFPSANSGASSLGTVFAPYDATNIDASLTHLTNMWYTPFAPPSSGLSTGGSGQLKFQANVLDTSDKLFAYETVASGWAGGYYGPGGSKKKVASFGYSRSLQAVPEPTTMLVWTAFAGAGLAMCGRRRHAS